MDSVPADADARDDALRAIALLLCTAALLFADGGTVLFSGVAGPYLVTVFADPAPLRTGATDVSVLLQRKTDQSPVIGHDVLLRFSKPGQADVLAHATQATASNKLMAAAQVHMSEPGKWQLQVKFEGVTVSHAVDVLPPEARVLTYWPYFVVVPAGVLLFAINQRLKAKRRFRNPTART